MELVDLLDLREVADVFTNELLHAKPLPPPAEARISLEVGLRVPPVLPERLVVGGSGFPGRTDDLVCIGKRFVKGLRD